MFQEEKKERYESSPKQTPGAKPLPCKLEKILSRRIDEPEFQRYTQSRPKTKPAKHWIFIR